jgi:DNA-binding transcriptional regulator PaaX
MKKDIQQIILKLSGGLFFTVSDLILYSLYLFGESFFKSPGSRGVYEMSSEASKLLENINSRTIYTAIRNLKYNSKYISKSSKRSDLKLTLTEKGYEYLNKSISTYKQVRPWNQKFYLISFDIPEKKRGLRDDIRRMIKKEGGGLLQISLWITPYYPRWIENIEGNLNKDAWVVVSEMTKDGLYPFNKIGLSEMIERVYRLKELDDRYRKFIQSVHILDTDKLRVMFDYLNILKDDPQLPFELEPEGFSSKQAYESFQKLKR